MAKGRKILVLVGLLSLALLTWPPAGSAQYLGEVIWTATITQKETGPVVPPETATLTAGLTRVGGNYYSLQGLVTGIPYPVVLSGGGVLSGDTLILTSSSGQKEEAHTTKAGSVVYLAINRTTLNGEFFEVGAKFNTVSRTFQSQYTAGTLTRTGGISTLGMSFPGANNLLLGK